MSKKEANKKLKNFDFTVKEKNIIMDKFKGNAKTFLFEYVKKAI